MSTKGKIGVIIPSVNDALSEHLDGIHRKASQLGYDTFVFTNSSNPMNNHPYTNYITGAEKIYDLGINSNVDGFIFAAGQYMKRELICKLAEKIKKTGKPCVTLSYPNKMFPNVYADEDSAIETITDHLINLHGYRIIYCLTGTKGIYESEKRLEYFKKSIIKNGLDINKCLTFYGDFWKFSSAEIASKIGSGTVPKPDAVVCGNDIMAISLCENLKKYGYRIPEDIAVTGFDGSVDAFVNSPSVTTVSSTETILGEKGVIKLYELMNGKPPENMETDNAVIHYNKSCGCNVGSGFRKNEYISRQIEFNRTFSEYFLTSDFIVRLSNTSDLDDFIRTVDSLTFLLPKWKNLEVCIREDWKGDFENPNKNDIDDYPPKTLLLLSRSRERSAYRKIRFDSKNLLCKYDTCHEPRFIVFLPLHYEKRILGYCAAEYERGGNYIMEERCKSWCDAVSNGLHILREKLYTEYMKKTVEEYSVRDVVTGMFNCKGFIRTAKNNIDSNRSILMLVSWRKLDVSEAGMINENYIIHIANAVQLSCGENEICGRISEKNFAFLKKNSGGGNTEKYADDKIIHIIKLLNSARSQIRNLPLPEFESVCINIENKENIDEIIDNTQKKLTEKLSKVKERISNYSAALANLRLEMYCNPQFKWNLDEIVLKFRITKSYFMKLYKKEFGTTWNDDLIHYRIEKAKHLLITTNKSIKEVAGECGYSDLSHFMRQFKERTDTTATKFRKAKAK